MAALQQVKVKSSNAAVNRGNNVAGDRLKGNTRSMYVNALHDGLYAHQCG